MRTRSSSTGRTLTGRACSTATAPTTRLYQKTTHVDFRAARARRRASGVAATDRRPGLGPDARRRRAGPRLPDRRTGERSRGPGPWGASEQTSTACVGGHAPAPTTPAGQMTSEGMPRLALIDLRRLLMPLLPLNTEEIEPHIRWLEWRWRHRERAKQSRYRSLVLSTLPRGRSRDVERQVRLRCPVPSSAGCTPMVEEICAVAARCVVEPTPRTCGIGGGQKATGLSIQPCGAAAADSTAL